MTEPREIDRDNIPANPYADEAATAPRLADKPGYPQHTPWFRADLTDEAQLGQTPSPPQAPAPSPQGDEPTFALRASDPMFGMLVRFWANANARQLSREAFDLAHGLAARGDAWRERNSGGG